MNLLKTIFVFLFVSIFAPLQAQPRLNKNIDLDTVQISIDLPNSFSDEMRDSTLASIHKGVSRYNKEFSAFVVEISERKDNYWMKMSMGNIKYVELKHNILWTGIDVLIIVGQVAFFANNSILLPILPLWPSTISKVQLECSEELLTNKPKLQRLYVNPSGYWRSREKQDEKFIDYSEKAFYRFFKRLAKQDKRNNK